MSTTTSSRKSATPGQRAKPRRSGTSGTGLLTRQSTPSSGFHQISKSRAEDRVAMNSSSDEKYSPNAVDKNWAPKVRSTPLTKCPSPCPSPSYSEQLRMKRDFGGETGSTSLSSSDEDDWTTRPAVIKKIKVEPRTPPEDLSTRK